MVCSALCSAAVRSTLLPGNVADEPPSLRQAFSRCVELLGGLTESTAARDGGRECLWHTVLQLLQRVWEVLVRCDGDGEGGSEWEPSCDVALAWSYLGLAMVLLLCPAQPLDPLMVDGAQQQLYKLLVCLLHCKACTFVVAIVVAVTFAVS